MSAHADNLRTAAAFIDLRSPQINMDADTMRLAADEIELLQWRADRANALINECAYGAAQHALRGDYDYERNKS